MLSGGQHLSPMPPFPRLFPGPALSLETWISIMQCVCCGSTNLAGPGRNRLRCKGDNQRRPPRRGELQPGAEGRLSCPYRRPNLCKDLWKRTTRRRGYRSDQPSQHPECTKVCRVKERYGRHSRGSANPACMPLSQSGPCPCLPLVTRDHQGRNPHQTRWAVLASESEAAS